MGRGKSFNIFISFQFSCKLNNPTSIISCIEKKQSQGSRVMITTAESTLQSWRSEGIKVGDPRESNVIHIGQNPSNSKIVLQLLRDHTEALKAAIYNIHKCLF
ncbi:hypothetical protein Tco_1431996, partial [Tanacetum coccineum]